MRKKIWEVAIYAFLIFYFALGLMIVALMAITGET